MASAVASTLTSSAPRVDEHAGTGIVVAATRPKSAALENAATGDITFNFVDTDVRQILRSVLGDLLHLNYVIDSRVKASLTVETTRPLKRADVLPALEQVLNASGLSLVEAGGIYRVIPSDEATRTGALPVVVGNNVAAPARYNVQVLPLRYASAEELLKTLQPYVPKGAQLRADSARNLLILSGTGQDLATAIDMVRTFDVDWLSGMSFAIVPLETAAPKDVVGQLEKIFGAGGATPLPGVLRFAPLDRMNAVLVVSPQRRYVDEARAWIERLDTGEGDNEPRIYEYHVENGRAADIAKVLLALFSNGTERNAAETAPGSVPVQLAGATNGPQSSQTQASASNPLSPYPQLGLSSTPGLTNGGPTSVGVPPTSSALPMLGTQGSLPLPPFPGSQAGTESQAENLPPQPPGLMPPPVRIVADDKNNTLVIYARPRDYRIIAQALPRIDVVPVQVLIEATIAEVTLDNDLQFGLQYFFKQHDNEFTFGNTTVPIAPPIPGTFPGFNYIFAGTNTNFVLNALKAITDVRVVSSPELLVLDHQAASLVVGDEIPVPISQIQSFATSGTPVVGNSIQYIDTGVVLHVSPRVNANGLITLDITQEVSNVATPAANTPVGAPTIEQRKIESTVTVQTGETVALGGLITNQKSNTVNGLPLLSDIPVIGPLFRSTDHSTTRTELLILLSPKVLHNPSEAQNATEELRRRLRALAPDDSVGF